MAELKWLVNTWNYYYFWDAPVHATGVSLNKSSITLTTAWQTEQLTATVSPDDAVEKKVIWSSSDTSIATVSSTGLVTCVTPGSATITATCADGGVSASCSVTQTIPITTPWIYHNVTLWLISLSSDWENWITIADKNLWATSTDVTSQNSFWKYYQRWNNYWYYYWSTVSLGSTIDASSYWPDNYYSSSNFVKNYLWDSSNNWNLRWWVTDTNTARRWPCDTGFHVPSRQDYISLINLMSSLWLTVTNETAFITYLFFARPWYWNYGNGSWNPIFWTDNYTRISDYYSDWAAYSLRYASNISNYNTAMYEWYWLTIRPFKNEAVQPDETWTVLYQSS